MADSGNVIVWIDNRPIQNTRDAVIALHQEKYPSCNLHYLNPRFFEHPQTVGIYWNKVSAVVLATAVRTVHDSYRHLFAADVDGAVRRPLHVLVEPAPAVEDTPSPDPENIPTMRCLVYVDQDSSDNRRRDFLKMRARQQFPGLSIMEMPTQGFERAYLERVKGVVVERQYSQIAQTYHDRDIPVLIVEETDITLVEQADALPNPATLPSPADSVDVESAKAILGLPLSDLAALLEETADPLFVRACADLEFNNQNRPEVQQLLHKRLQALGSTNPHLGQGPGEPAPSPETPQEPSTDSDKGDKAPVDNRPVGSEMRVLASRTVEEMKELLPTLNLEQCIQLYEAEEQGRARSTALLAIQDQMRRIADADEARSSS